MVTAAAQTLPKLRNICGAGGARPAENRDRVGGVLPSYVAAVSTRPQLVSLMRFAATQNWTVVPRGGGSKLEWSGPVQSCDLVVDMSGMDSIIEHAPDDMIVRVQAGVTLARLAEVLRDSNQQLALDTTSSGRSQCTPTVGGAIATGYGGPRRLRYGTASDLLLGMTIVRADGVSAVSGSKVVKNVAGYDIAKLFTGAYGTLGIVAEATFRLHPLPAATRWVTAVPENPDIAGRFAREIAGGPWAPSAVEFKYDGERVELCTMVEGTHVGVAARADRIAQLCGGTCDTVPPRWFGAWHALEAMVLRVSCLPTRLPAALEAVRAVACDTEASFVCTGGAALGSFLVSVTPSTPQGNDRFVRTLRHALDQLKARAVVTVAPAGDGLTEPRWGAIQPAVLRLMRRVKDQFDPEHRLSPGRFVGGM